MAVKKPGISSDNPNRRVGRYDAVGDNDVGHRYTETDNRNVARYGSAVVELVGVTISAETFHSLGITVDLGVSDDTDYNATVAVEYKKSSSGTWKNALGLIRNDYQWFWTDNYPPTQPAITNFSGSIMFLTPGTNYDIRLTYSDPQASDPQHNAVYEGTVSTRAVPVKPTGGTTYYAHQGHGGTNVGTSANPFNSLGSANAAVSPGDIVLLRDTGGTFTNPSMNLGLLTTSGEEGNYIVYEPDSGHTPVIESIGIEADHIWLDNLTFTYSGGFTTPAIFDEDWWETSAIYVPPQPPGTANPEDVVVTGCSFADYENAIFCSYPVSRWVVMDNSVVGVWPAGAADGAPPGGSAGKGFNLGGENQWGRSGANDPVFANPTCVVAFNDVTRCTDSIGVYENSDVYSNRVWDSKGNALSMDGGYGNIRVWGNEFQWSIGAPITFQPQRIGPWYWLYNQMGQADNNVFKFKTLDRAVMINNTLVSVVGSADHFMRFYMRNNIFAIPSGTGACWNSQTGTVGTNQSNVPQYTADWNTDIDYDGFIPGSTNYFFWGSTRINYSSIASWTTAVGGNAEANGVELTTAVFDSTAWTNHLTGSTSYNNPLDLAAGSNDAVDAGILVDNLADWHGATPDLGAYQRGATALLIGQRTSELSTALHLRTDDWTKH